MRLTWVLLPQEFLRWPVERLAGGAVRLGAGNVHEAVQKVPSGLTGLLSAITPEFIEYIVKARRETVRKIGRALRAFRIVAANELNLPAPIVEHIDRRSPSLCRAAVKSSSSSCAGCATTTTASTHT
eukprot:COSAG04_NODE_1678_length_5966_cov_3.433612_5_plen_127_part_00